MQLGRKSQIITKSLGVKNQKLTLGLGIQQSHNTSMDLMNLHKLMYALCLMHLSY